MLKAEMQAIGTVELQPVSKTVWELSHGFM